MKPIDIPLYELKLPRAVSREVSSTLKSTWLSSGPKVKGFEEAIRLLESAKYAAATNSATVGLTAALRAIRVKDREVITTPFSFVATIEAILHAGGRPVLADIEPDSLNIDPTHVGQLVKPETACVVPVDIAGHPVDYSNLRKITRTHGIPILADASHSLGSLWKGKSVSRWSDAAVLSFHATKNLVCGEGGMVLTNKEGLIDKVRSLCNHGLTANAADRRRRGELTYDAVDLGYKGTMSELHAAVGLGHMTVFDKNQMNRRRNAERYLANLSDLRDWIGLPIVSPQARPAWHLFIIQLRLQSLKITRDQFIAEMAEQGVECGRHFIPVTSFSYYRDLYSSPSLHPQASRAGERVVTLPLYPTLKVGQIDRVCDSISSIVRKYRR